MHPKAQKLVEGRQSPPVKSAATAGFMGAVLATTCCLPGAIAVAIGASVGTSASLFRLQDYQRLFQVAGLALALAWSWWLIKRSRKTCSVEEHQRNKNRVPLLVIGGFAVSFLVLNVALVPWLERGS